MRHTNAALSLGGITHSLTRWALREFFERPPHGLVGDLLHVPELDHPVGQQPQRPASPPLGGLQAGERHSCASARPSSTRLLGLPGFLGISATSRPSSQKRRRSRATVAALVSRASAIRPSVQAGPPSAASALSRIRAYSSLRACALPRRTRASRVPRSSSVRRTTYLLCMANLPRGVT